MERPKPIPWIRELCAHLTEEGILEAEENWRNYLALVHRIVQDEATREKEGLVGAAEAERRGVPDSEYRSERRSRNGEVL